MEETGKGMRQVTIEDVVSIFKNFSDAKTMAQIKSAMVAKFTPEGELLCPDADLICNEVERIIKEDKKLGDSSQLTYNKGKYKKRKNKSAIKGVTLLSKTYMGTAGECAVMSELIFREYNTNRMMIDEGVDIIANKGHVYYYIQVKTTTVDDNGTIHTQIDKERFQQYTGSQIRYAVVARYRKGKEERNLFFFFSPATLMNAIHSRCVNQGEKYVTINIRFDEKTGEPLLYYEKEMPIGYYMGNFDLDKV